jgi:SAM-dependent methyltransferase
LSAQPSEHERDTGTVGLMHTVDRDEWITRADIEFHAATADVYEETLDPLFRAHNAVVTEPLLDSLARLAPGREALDVGCGTGLNTFRLAQRGFRVQGIDHSPAMLASAERKRTERGFADRVKLQTGDARSLPFEDERFDLIICIGVLHHLPSIRQAMVEAQRVLRPSGVLCVAEPCLGTNPALRSWDAMRRLRARLPARLSLRSDDEVPEGAPKPEDVPEHEEGPIEVAELTAVLDELRMGREVTYWSFFRGLHRFGPLWFQKAVVLAGSRPWRRRGGNMVVMLARRPAGRL